MDLLISICLAVVGFITICLAALSALVLGGAGMPDDDAPESDDSDGDYVPPSDGDDSDGADEADVDED